MSCSARTAQSSTSCHLFRISVCCLRWLWHNNLQNTNCAWKMRSELKDGLRVVFALACILTVLPSNGGSSVELRWRNSTCRVALRGGMVVSYVPDNSQEVIALGERGGIPVCWPWFVDETGRDLIRSGDFGAGRRDLGELLRKWDMAWRGCCGTAVLRVGCEPAGGCAEGRATVS